jgi:hypothetical protein
MSLMQGLHISSVEMRGIVGQSPSFSYSGILEVYLSNDAIPTRKSLEADGKPDTIYRTLRLRDRSA